MYYCINCLTGNEESVKRRIEKYLESRGFSAFVVWFPQKENKERKNGAYVNTLKPLFPSYLFLLWNEDSLLPVADIRILNGVLKFLGYSDGTVALRGKDLEYAQWISENDGIIKPSKVSFASGDKVKIVDGPLKGFDGQVVKVDRHHRRITVRFFMGEDCSDVSFSVEFMEYSTKKAGEAAEE